MNKLIATAFAAGLAGASFAQSVTITPVVTSGEPFAAGDTLTVELQYDQSGFGAGAGPAAIGVDVDVTDANGVALAIQNVQVVNLTTGALTGTINGLSIDRIVAGQPANVFNVNPGVLVDADTPITFATFEVTTDGAADCSTNPVVNIAVSEAANGGVRVYDDATDTTAAGGANSLIAGVAYGNVDATCGGAVALVCLGDTDGDLDADADDFIAVLVGFGTQAGATAADGDFDGDGDVDADDFIGMLVAFGRSYDAQCNIL
ncbi:MAG: hypothetical protein AAGI30_06495 [Planctomycetota bacterium]